MSTVASPADDILNGSSGDDESDNNPAIKDVSSSSDDDSSSSSASGGSSSDDSSSSDDDDSSGSDDEKESTTQPPQPTSSSISRTSLLASVTKSTRVSHNNNTHHRRPPPVSSSRKKFSKASNDPSVPMALNTRKRDRRTIEEIQREMKSKRPNSRPTSRAASPLILSSDDNETPSSSVIQKRKNLATRALPVSASSVVANAATVLPKNSTRSRLAKKVLGRKKKSSSRTSISSVKKQSSTTTTTVVKTKTKSDYQTASSSEAEVKSSTLSSTTTGSNKKKPLSTQKLFKTVLNAIMSFGTWSDFDSTGTAKSKFFDYMIPKFTLEQWKDTVEVVVLDNNSLYKVIQAFALEKVINPCLETCNTDEEIFKGIKVAHVLCRVYWNSEISKLTKFENLEIPAWETGEAKYDWISPSCDVKLLRGLCQFGFGHWEEIVSNYDFPPKIKKSVKRERLKKRAETLCRVLFDSKKTTVAKNILAPIRNTMKKLTRMEAWASNGHHTDAEVARKMLKYVVEIGEFITKQKCQYQKSLWIYVAERYTPLSGPHVEQLYQDICADVAAQQQ